MKSIFSKKNKSETNKSNVNKNENEKQEDEVLIIHNREELKQNKDFEEEKKINTQHNNINDTTNGENHFQESKNDNSNNVGGVSINVSTERWLPIYYDAIKVDGVNYGKAVKCFVDVNGKVSFTNQIIDFETKNNVVGFMFYDENLEQVSDKIFINNKLKNLFDFMQSLNDNQCELYIKTRKHFNFLVNKYISKESVCLEDDELLDFKIELQNIFQYQGNDLLDKVQEMKIKYKSISNERSYEKVDYLPLFCVIDDDFALSTVCVKCVLNDEGVVEFKDNFELKKGFNIDKVGIIYFDKELNKDLTKNEIQEKLGNLNFAIDFFGTSKSQVDVKNKVYDAENETKRIFYVIAKNYLDKGNPFVEEKDKINAKLIIEQIKQMTTTDLLNNILKIKEKVDYVIDDEKGIKYMRPRQMKKNNSNNKTKSLDLRGLHCEDIHIM